MELGERKQKILQALIESYIETGEPVGSKLLTEKLQNAVSSATIRNEMAELVSLGYLEQPHTSAGRIPTAQAFRLYIDRLMQPKKLTAADKRAIDETLATAGDPETLMEDASSLLAETTGCAAVTTTPLEHDAVLRRVELLRASPRAAALLLMTSSGVLRSRVCRIPELPDDSVLATVAGTLTDAFVGKPLSSITLPQVQSLLLSLGDCGLIGIPILTAFYELVQASAEAEVLLRGQMNLLRHPDYAPERAHSLLGFLTEREQLIQMLAACPVGLRVVLGSESLCPELKGSSLVVTRYEPHGSDGTIGLIGPLRMNYAAAIPRLAYVAAVIGRLLDQLTEE